MIHLDIEKDEVAARERAYESMTKPAVSFVVTMRKSFVSGDCRVVGIYLQRLLLYIFVLF